MHRNWPYSDWITLLILTPLVALFAFALDLYIPIVPDLRDQFSTTEELMQVTLSGYMFFCAIGQIVFGPLSDRYGRRRVALVALSIFIIGSIYGYGTTSLPQMIICRVLESIGASGTFLCAYATVRDLYPNKEHSAKIYSYINVCIAQSPIFAPTIGGIIAETYHWQAVFIALTLLGLLTSILTLLCYKETAPHKRSINTQSLKQTYQEILTSPNFLVYTLAASTGVASFFMFFSQSPYIIIDILGFSQSQYGLFFGIIGSAFFISSLYTPRLCRQIGIHKTVEIGSGLIALGAILLITLQYIFGITVLCFILPMTFVVSGASFCIAAGISGTMEPFGHIAGSAFSAIGFCKFMLSALLGIILMQLSIEPNMLGMIMLLFSGLSIILCIIYRSQLIQHASESISVHSEYD